jgi:hypothetical protein
VEYEVDRFFLDVLYNLIVNLVLVSIIAGIIIDTFGLLRDAENNIIHDKHNYCFICGLHREKFDNLSSLEGGFKTHITKDHEKWNYLFFVAYLK